MVPTFTSQATGTHLSKANEKRNRKTSTTPAAILIFARVELGEYFLTYLFAFVFCAIVVNACWQRQ